MTQQLSPTDSRRVAIFDRFVRNANHLLKKKSVKEIEKMIDDQEGFIKGIKDSETKERLLGISKELRDTALASLQNFESVMKRIKKGETLLHGEAPEEITTFFDEIDKDISEILDQRIRQTIQKTSRYWRARCLDESYINSTTNIIKKYEVMKK